MTVSLFIDLSNASDGSRMRLPVADEEFIEMDSGVTSGPSAYENLPNGYDMLEKNQIFFQN